MSSAQNPPPDGSATDRHDDLIYSWKEIAHHLGVSERTAQSRGYDDGLPFRREPGRRGRVFALRGELDAWSRERLGLRDPETDGAAVPDPPAQQTADNSPERPEVAQRKPHRLLRPLLVGATILVACVVLLAVRTAHHARQPSSFSVAGRTLTALDQEGRMLWRYELPGNQFPPDQLLPSMVYLTPTFADLDGDGQTEVLFPFQEADPVGVGPSALYCFSSSGDLRWKRQLGREMRTVNGRHVFPADYQILWVKALRKSGPRGGVVVVGGHCGLTSLFVVELLDKSGKVVGEYYHPGWLYSAAVADLDGDGFEEVILGGVNNAYGNLPGTNYNMTIVVLDSRRLDGAGPAPPNDDRRFAGLPSGTERAVVLLPEFGQRPSDPDWAQCIIDRIRTVPGGLVVHALRSVKPDYTLEWSFDSRLRLRNVFANPDLADLIDTAAGLGSERHSVREQFHTETFGALRYLKNDLDEERGRVVGSRD